MSIINTSQIDSLAQAILAKSANAHRISSRSLCKMDEIVSTLYGVSNDGRLSPAVTAPRGERAFKEDIGQCIKILHSMPAGRPRAQLRMYLARVESRVQNRFAALRASRSEADRADHRDGYANLENNFRDRWLNGVWL